MSAVLIPLISAVRSPTSTRMRAFLCLLTMALMPVRRVNQTPAPLLLPSTTMKSWLRSRPNSAP